MAKNQLVYIESPFAASEDLTVEDHTEYAKLCLTHSLELGEFPFVSHLLFTLVLDDLAEDERRIGMHAGEAWASQADIRALYTDLGTSRGMLWGEANATKLGQTIEHRSIHSGSIDND